MESARGGVIRAVTRDRCGTAFRVSGPSEEYGYDYYAEEEDDCE